ncbi:2,3-bisphosphoglycerate-independent phosphoglycerate mutase [Candidatus Phytoplasma australiense]|uniref:2,3-bisphosphoglycerate-independent phosphoglycerate mutase n=1 Tax=Phytoplasma australiense TaxID=59748 RepID=B1V8R7_PHYAS|nr:2,3-bisphosphoglycerate-independent phosphoglycerate mutase [Candidatus Phytoplasma australiense]
MTKFAALLILDGLGLSCQKENNAFYLAKTPYLDYLLKTFPTTTLQASGEAVGLPEGQMGNSEVGHLNLGAGRVVDQYLTQINKSIRDQSFLQNKQFLKAIEHAKKNHSKIHLLGLVSEGGVHSHLDHFKALLELMKKHQIADKTYLHVFTDGRDDDPVSGVKYLQQMIDDGFQIASVSGRYYALDRDNNWDRINLVYDMLTLGTYPVIKSCIEEIKSSYQKGITDEFIKPFLVNPDGLINDNDSLIFVNFRSDRIMRLATAFSNPSMTASFQTPGKTPFKGQKLINNAFIVNMTFYSQYAKGEIAFQPTTLKNLYGKVIADHNLHQLRIAETEKYPHVTFFFDGGKELQLPNSKHLLIPSPRVATYDLKPEMGAYEITSKAKEAILSKKYQTMILNFANPDMVGHTGSLEAAIKAVEVVDSCLKGVVEAIQKIDGIACVVADHGNAEQMTDEAGKPHTAHTTNLVPFVITSHKVKLRQETGALCDVAPTLLELLGIPQPPEMTGISLIEKTNKTSK